MNKLARYIGNGNVEIVSEPMPVCPPGGLLVETEACGLCSGELMAWYMDRKLPHVLGHEVAGTVRESQDDRFPVGSRVFPHHHAPCLQCDLCRRGQFVHCLTWKRTKLQPGGMAQFFAVAAENLTDTHRIDDLRALDGALIEPLACVAKAARLAKVTDADRIGVIGLGFMGLLHALSFPSCQATDLNPARRAWAAAQGVQVESPLSGEFEVLFVLPGVQAAFDAAITVAAPGARIVIFAPVPPDTHLAVPFEAYFRDIQVIHAYSAGPNDSEIALNWLREGRVRAEQVVTDWISLDELPAAYRAMRAGAILKPMVQFSR